MDSPNKQGLTLLEIIIATLILAMITAGLTNIFITGKRYMLHFRSRMTGGELGKFFLDPVQMNVRQDTWLTNCLNTGSPADCANLSYSAGISQGLDRDYTADYTITPGSPASNLNKVKVKISWSEAQ